MADVVEFRCFVGGLSWDTDDRSLNKAFEKYGAVDAKVVNDRETGRSRGFGFVTFGDKNGMDDAIDAMNGQELDGRSISVNVAQARGAGGPRRGGFGGGGDRYGGGGGDRYGGGGDRYRGGGDRYGGGDRGGDRYGGGGGGRGGGGGGACFKCGEDGHFARDCPSGDGGGGGGGKRYSGGYSGEDRGGSRSSRPSPYERGSGDSRGYD